MVFASRIPSRPFGLGDLGSEAWRLGDLGAWLLGGSLARLLGGSLAWVPIVPTLRAFHAPN